MDVNHIPFLFGVPSTLPVPGKSDNMQHSSYNSEFEEINSS